MDIGGLSVDKLKDQISKYEQEVKSLKEKAVKATGDAKAKIQAQIKDLQAKIADTKAKIEKLSSQGKDILGKGKDILGKFKK
jgi:chromosome segregation ATPase